MSRYTEEDLKGLNRPALLQLVLRQPNVPIPPKLTKQPPTTLTKDKLRKLLTGPFGFVRQELHEQGDVSMEEQTGRAGKEDASSGETQQIQDDFMREQRPTEMELKDPSGDSDQFQGDASMLEETTETAKVRVQHTISYPPKQLVETLGELALDPKFVEFPISGFMKQHTCAAADDLAFIHSKTDRSLSPDNHAYTSSTSITSAHIPTPSNNVPQNPVAPATKQELDSLIRMDDAYEYERNETGELRSSLHAILASLQPDVSIVVRAYFMDHPQDMKAWQSIHLARNKKKPDFAVIRYICQVLTLYDRLKSHPWPTDTGTLRSKDLAKVLGFSPSWFTNARHIREEYNKVGPESGRANDAIIARFQDKVAKKKSSDLLSFLRAQREIIERNAV